MIVRGTVEIMNCEKETDKYIVARVVMGLLWYWGSWDDKDAAHRVAETFENAIVIERKDDNAST